jgi:ADP-ribosylglycohydrolase
MSLLRPDSLQRAHQSLIGLAIGDALGAFFEFSHGRISRRVSERIVPSGIWHWTDDTHMALSLFSVLRQYGTIEPDAFASSLVKHYDRSRGYGRSIRALVQRVRAGASWQEIAGQLFGQRGSYGNGCASRVAPVGAFFADDFTNLLEQARRSAWVTHQHPEAIAGTIAVASAAAWAWRLADHPIDSPADFLNRIVQHVPESEVRLRIVQARQLAADTPIAEVVRLLGNGNDATVQTTVPFALWCAAQRLENYEEAIWLTLQGQGDCDTTCAIVGGIVVLRAGIKSIPAAWYDACEALADWAFRETLDV